MSFDVSPSGGNATRGAWQRLLVVLLLVALDLASKSYLFGYLERAPGAMPPAGVQVWFNGHWRLPVWGDFLGLMLSENRGAAWGIGDKYPWLLVGGRCVAVALLAYMVARAGTQARPMRIALVLILAGAAGNLYDNLLRPRSGGHPFGAVRDFIHVYFERWDYHFPTFNVADSCITVGAVFLIGSGLFPGRQAQPAEARQG
jgi:signal peptidase II